MRRVYIVAAACAALPDIDVIGWPPLGVPNGGLVAQLAQEAVLVLLPAVLLGWLGTKARRASDPSRSAR